jgi:hypothetical protein
VGTSCFGANVLDALLEVIHSASTQQKLMITFFQVSKKIFGSLMAGAADRRLVFGGIGIVRAWSRLIVASVCDWALDLLLASLIVSL